MLAGYLYTVYFFQVKSKDSLAVLAILTCRTPQIFGGQDFSLYLIARCIKATYSEATLYIDVHTFTCIQRLPDIEDLLDAGHHLISTLKLFALC